MNYYNYFVTKVSLNNIPYRKLSLSCKQHSKTRKEHVLIEIYFNKSLISFILVKSYYIKHVQKQSFADVLQNRSSWNCCKIHRKIPLLNSLFNEVTSLKRLRHKCFHTIFLNLSRTPYNKTPYAIKIAYG